MEAVFRLLSWRIAAIAGSAYIVYFIVLVVYRLFFHPLAKFPGPRRAAATYLYEGYYDVVQNGRYTFKIAELHKKYGPVIRINPNEVHIIDPSFYKTIYRQEGIWNKDPYAQGAQPPVGAAIATVDHHQHKARRSPYNAVFSKAKVAAQQDLIHRHLTILIDRISEFANNTNESKKTFDLGLTASAYTRDIADEEILGQNYHNLEQPDFNAALTSMIQDIGYVWRINKHMPFVYLSDIMFSIPEWLVTPFSDDSTRVFFKYLTNIREISDQAMKDWEEEKKLSFSSPHGDDGNGRQRVTEKKNFKQRTVIHHIMDSNNLPPSDKTLLRIWEEMTTITAAGFETTASCLRTIYFHLWSNKAILRRVREELAAHNIPYEISELDIKALEQLPYLTAVICEGLRLSPGIATRMGRVAPDRDIVYVDNYSDRRAGAKEGKKGARKEWVIPKGYTFGMTTLLMHLDEELYPNPTEFRPERWIDGPDGLNARKIAEGNGTFAPFSRGTRICLGMYLGWAEMYIALAALVQRFDFELHGAKAEDFLASSDQFIIGTNGRGVLKATPRRVKV